MDQDRRLCLIASNDAAPVHKRHRQGVVEPEWKKANAPIDSRSIRPHVVALVRIIGCPQRISKTHGRAANGAADCGEIPPSGGSFCRSRNQISGF
jgi:hypothetical protein